MVESIGGRMTVGMAELQGIITSCNIKAMSARGQLEIARRGCRNTPAAYYLDSLPYKYRVEVYKRYPDLEAQKKYKPFIESIELDGQAVTYYENYRFEDGSRLPKEKVEEYSANASILYAFGKWLDGSNAQRIKTSHARCPKGEFWQSAAASLSRIGDYMPHTLPNNARRLQSKYNQLIKEGLGALVSGKMKNSNATKIDSEEKRALITLLCSNPNGLDNEFVAKRYNECATRLGWECITSGTIAKYKKENSTLVCMQRGGEREFKNSRTMQVKRSRPTGAMLMWSLDGWDAEFYYQKRNSKGVVTYTNRKVLEVVLDPCCDFPIGFAIGDVENGELIIEALRDAANYTRTLFGSRYRTCQVQSDRFALSMMQPYYATVADKVVPAQAGNAKSKPIERYFHYLNQTYGKWFENWSGCGVTSRKSHQPNVEFKNLIKKNFPTEEEVVEQLRRIMEMERMKKMEEYSSFWDKTPEQHRLPLTDDAFLLRFGATTGHSNTLEGCGLRVRIGGERRQYDCFDVRFRELAHLRWEVRYDVSDLSHVLAVSEDGRERFVLEEKYIQPMALAERTEEDSRQLQRVREYNATLMQHMNVTYERISAVGRPLLKGGAPEQLENPDIYNEYSKMLITDSKGQHKRRRAEKRRQLNGELAEYEVVDTVTAKDEEVKTFDLY